LTPSVVGFAKSGEILVGKKARRAAVMNVGRTVFSIKRHMGTSYRAKAGGKEYTPQEISSMILQKLKQDTEDFFGEEVSDAVITVPAYFTDTQRQATKDAGEIAGFDVRRIIDEPTAAALAYGLDKGKDQVILVFDLGGGTFDVAIIEVISGVFRVLAIHGNTKLGGDDFDQRIIDHLVEVFKEANDFDLREDPVAMARLRDAAEEAKIELSELRESPIMVEAIAMGDKGPLTLETTLTREKLESLIKDLIHQTVEPIESVITDSGIERDNINTVLLVGGSTRIPLVQRTVKKSLDIQPSRDISPEEVVSLGAAIQTVVLAPLHDALEGTEATVYGKEKPVIVHMTPFSLGVGLQSDQFQPIIERNSTYPTEGTDIFTTTRDFQETISFPIYEGEETVASENTFLDLLRIEGITPAPRGVPRIEVTFRLNPDRILEVRGEDLATGVEKRISIASTASRLSDSEKTRMVRESRDRVAKDLTEKIKRNVADEAHDVINRAEELMKSLNDHPRGEDIHSKIADLRTRLDSGDTAELEDLVFDLTRVVNEIEASTM
ncbi:Hsp70 family protein, partial [Candidatus Sumerlaeota bacterium]|nr:Hsp70 family protein [Candidatus Sumerlaeota bacterium]